jgi:hypothetical protein
MMYPSPFALTYEFRLPILCHFRIEIAGVSTAFCASGGYGNRMRLRRQEIDR